MKKSKKIVMYLDGTKSVHKDVLSEALSNYVTLSEMKKQLKERFYQNNVTFKVE